MDYLAKNINEGKDETDLSREALYEWYGFHPFDHPINISPGRYAIVERNHVSYLTLSRVSTIEDVKSLAKSLVEDETKEVLIARSNPDSVQKYNLGEQIFMGFL